MDVYILALCSGEYEDYIESPEYMFFHLSAAKHKWSELILQEKADNKEYDIISMALGQYDEQHLDEVFHETIGFNSVDFYDFLDEPEKYPEVLRKFTTGQQEMFLKFCALNNRYEQLGGFSRTYSPDGLSPTLTCVKGGGIEPKILLSKNPNVIRKLTPREFWRLQGFTDQQFDTCAKIQSNAQLYKQAGNSVSIPIVYELGKKIIEHHRRLHGNE